MVLGDSNFLFVARAAVFQNKYVMTWFSLGARPGRPGCGTSCPVPDNPDAAATTHGFWEKKEIVGNTHQYFKHARVSCSGFFLTGTCLYMFALFPFFREINTRRR